MVRVCAVLLVLLGFSLACSGGKPATSLEDEVKALQVDTMLQNRTIRRLFKEKDSLEAKILLDSLRRS